MSKHMTFPRGLIRAKADATPTQVLAEMQKAWSELKASIDGRASDWDKRDGVVDDKIGKINNAITDLTKQLEDVNTRVQAAKIDGAGAVKPEDAEHFKAFNQYFRKGTVGALGDLQVKAALTSQVDGTGGYVVPREVSTTIDRVSRNLVTMRQLASVMSISAPEYRKYFNMGGGSSGWVGEEDSRTETNTPTLRELIYTMQEIYAMPATTQRLLDTAIIDIGAWLSSEVDITFAEAENNAFLNGTGVKQPFGLLNYPTVANASWSWGNIGFIKTGVNGGFAASAPADDLVELLYALKPMYRNSSSYLMTDAAMLAVRLQKDGQGNYLWAPPEGDAAVPTILNKPVYTDDYMPAYTTTGAFGIACGDFKQAYHIFDMPGMKVLRDDVTQKGRVLFYTTKYVTGGIGNFEAIKFLQFSA